MEKKYFIILFTILAILLVGGGFFFYTNYLNEYKYGDKSIEEEGVVSDIAQPVARNVHNELLEKNEAYVSGENFYKSKDYANAINRYRDALQISEDMNEKGQIEYKIGIAYVSQGKIIEAIQLFKEIATNNDLLPSLRAFSVQQIGALFYRNNSQVVYEEIFKGEQFEQLKSNEDIEKSMRNLFEYGAAFHRLGVLETRIARSYSLEAVEIFESEVSDANLQQKFVEAKLIARQRIANADIYLANLTEGDPDYIYRADILLRKAAVFGDLTLVGENVPDAEKAFNEALEVAVAGGSVAEEASAKFLFAVFLSKQYGSEREEKVSELLQEFYNSQKYENTGVGRSIKNEITNSNGILRDELLILSEVDPLFAQYLKNLGFII